MAYATVFLIFSIATSTLARSWTPRDPCPVAISTTVPGGSYNNRNAVVFDTTDSVHSALTHCPNITSLNLRITLMGCSEWPDRWTFPFNPAVPVKYPALKTVRLEGYNFNEKQWPRERWEVPRNEISIMDWMAELFYWVARGDVVMWWRVRRLGREQREKTNLDLWIDAMDWGGVEELRIEATKEVLEKLPGRLDSLRILETTSLPFITAVKNNTIANLTWVGPFEEETLPTIIEHQGQSLTSLELRCPELVCESTPIDNKQLGLLVKGVPNLRHLSTNIHRNGTGSWPLEVFSTLSSHPSLRTLDVWLNMQSSCRRQKPDGHDSTHREWLQQHGLNACDGEDQYQRPFIDEASALMLFKRMRAEKKGEELQRVVFWVGDWTRPWDGPLYLPDWLEGRRAKIACMVERKEDGLEWCGWQEGNEYWKKTSRYMD